MNSLRHCAFAFLGWAGGINMSERKVAAVRSQELSGSIWVICGLCVFVFIGWRGGLGSLSGEVFEGLDGKVGDLGEGVGVEVLGTVVGRVN